MSHNKVTPIFLFSLPRSGSTLVQRVIGAHDDIATTTEPWLLLPLFYTLKNHGVYAEYNYGSYRVAIDDFCASLPEGKADYLAELANMTLNLYGKCSEDGQRYFLDKTPRYHLIADDIVQAFPDARNIILWRNPLAVAASLMDTFSSGRWNLYRWKIDLYEGLSALVKTCQAESQTVVSVRFEDLVAEGEDNWGPIFSHLGLAYDESLLEAFSDVDLKGRWGDPTGVKDYVSVSEQPLSKWKKTLANPIRKAWCRRYIKWIGRERLAVMGYNYDELLGDIKSLPFSINYLFSDIVLMLFGVFYCWCEPYVMLPKFRNFFAWRRVHVHR